MYINIYIWIVVVDWHNCCLSLHLAMQRMDFRKLGCFQTLKMLLESFEAMAFFQVVVSNIFCIYPYLGKSSNLTNIFQMGWSHKLIILAGILPGAFAKHFCHAFSYSQILAKILPGTFANQFAGQFLLVLTLPRLRQYIYIYTDIDILGPAKTL